MPSLTSCYFCGEAVGASLGEYDFPAAGDESISVTLCATCGQKLRALLDRVDGPEGSLSAGDAIAGGPSAAGGATAGDRPATSERGGREDRAGHDRERDDGSDDRPDLPIDVDLPSQPGGAASEDGAPASDAPTDEAAGGVSNPLDGESDPVFEPPDSTPEETSDSAPAGASAAADEENADDGVVFGAADDGDVAGGDGGAAGSSGPGPDGDTEPDASAPTEDDGPRETGSSRNAASGQNATSAGDGVSPQTYNRVVRLLQNREFPVDRVEFETLASSAYDVDERDCAAALDVAIDKGLLLEQEGQLHRPE